MTDGPPHDPWYQAIVEIETTLTERKMRKIVTYAMAAALQTEGKPVYAMVITPDPKADRYDHPYTVIIGHMVVTMNVVIVGPSKIPIFTTAEEFREDPELGRLVIMAHVDIPGVKEAWAEGIPTTMTLRVTLRTVCDCPRRRIDVSWRQWWPR